MSAPNQQNSSDLFIITYEVTEQTPNPYYKVNGYSRECEFIKVTSQKHVVVCGKEKLFDYRNYKNVKFYRATEVFPRFEVAINIDV